MLCFSVRQTTEIEKFEAWLASKLESALAIYAYVWLFRVWIPGCSDSRAHIPIDTSTRNILGRRSNCGHGQPCPGRRPDVPDCGPKKGNQVGGTTLNASPSSETRHQNQCVLFSVIFKQPVSLCCMSSELLTRDSFSCAAVSASPHRQCVCSGVIPPCLREEDIG